MTVCAGEQADRFHTSLPTSHFPFRLKVAFVFHFSLKLLKESFHNSGRLTAVLLYECILHEFISGALSLSSLLCDSCGINLKC